MAQVYEIVFVDMMEILNIFPDYVRCTREGNVFSRL